MNAIANYAFGNIAEFGSVPYIRAARMQSGMFDLAATPMRVGTVALRVSDLALVCEFYHKIIGLMVLERGANHATLGHAGGPLLTLHAKPGLHRAEPTSAGLSHIAFLMPSRRDLACWFNHAVRCRIPFDAALDHGVSEGIYIADPEGNGVEICADYPQDQWKKPGRDDLISVEALDVHALMERACIDTYRGFPKGGTVGHVHLHVGNLDQAEAFYKDVLGFDVTQRMDGAALLASGGYHHQLAVNVRRSSGAAPRDANCTGLEAIELLLRDPADKDEILARAEAAGVRDGDAVVDPWGNRFTLRD